MKWILDFIALLECENFSEAANRRGITQPAFGRRIRALEHWVGVDLFHRSSRKVRPTPAGLAFRAAAEDTVRQVLLARDQAREAEHLSSGAITFGSTHLLASTFFPRWIPMIERHAGTDLHLQFVVDNMIACERMLRRSEIRVLLCHHHDAAPAELDPSAFLRLRVGCDRLMPVSAPGADGRPQFPLPEASGSVTPFLSYRQESGLGRILNASGLPHRLTGRLDPVFHAHAVLTLATLAKAGRGLAWVPFTAVQTALENGELVAAGSPAWNVDVEICLFRPTRRQSRALEAFWTAVSASGTKT